MRSGLRTEILSDTEAFARLEADWWVLWRCCANATPFQSPAWLLAWWRAFAPGALSTVAVWHGRVLVGLAPLYLEESSARLLPVGIGISDYLDVLVDPKHAGEVGHAFGTALDEFPTWTRLSLEQLAPGAAALSLPAGADWTEEARPQCACPVILLPRVAETVESVIPARKLRKLRMARNRVARRNGKVERADAGSASHHLEALFRLHAARWESRGERGVLADEDVRRFHAAALPGLVALDLLRSYLLRIEDRVAGVFYGLRSGDKLFAYLGGFDPAFGFESPGTVLMGHAIEEAIREGARELHLLRGRESYKYEWGAVDRWNTCRLFGRTPLSLAERGRG